MGEHAEIFRRLAAPFDAAQLSWLVKTKPAEGKKQALVLPYVNSRDIQDRFDNVVTPANWYPEISDNIDGFNCKLWLRLGGEWIYKMDGAPRTNVEGVKGGISGAIKRAAVQWGVGRYLYRLPAFWAKVKPRGTHWVIDEIPKLPKWATPAGGLAKTENEKWQEELSKTFEDSFKDLGKAELLTRLSDDLENLGNKKPEDKLARVNRYLTANGLPNISSSIELENEQIIDVLTDLQMEKDGGRHE